MLVPQPLHVDQTLEPLSMRFQVSSYSGMTLLLVLRPARQRPDSLQLRSSGSDSGRSVLPWAPLMVPTSEQHGQEPGTAGRARGRQATDGF